MSISLVAIMVFSLNNCLTILSLCANALPPLPSVETFIAHCIRE